MSASDEVGRLKALFFDVDGVLTDNGLWIDQNGGVTKRFDIRDGAGLKMAMTAGYTVGLISGHRSQATEERARELGIGYCYTGVRDKVAIFDEILGEVGLSAEQALFMGDDLMDLPVLRRAGFAATVPDAPEEVKAVCDRVSVSSGGHGAVRETVEFVLKSAGLFEQILARFR